VHPGESPSSYATEGLLEFLLDKKDYRSYILRKYFTILVVPMLNPDGVYKGMYRMDSLGQNLNRFYSTPQSHKQYLRTLT
jgi:murein tripeptide amidase MpaA